MAISGLTTVFELSTKPKDPGTRRLLIMDGYSSSTTANVIAFCIEKAIDLTIFPNHYLHIF